MPDSRRRGGDYVTYDGLQVILEPLWRDHRERETAKKWVEEVTRLGVFESLPLMLREFADRQTLKRIRTGRWTRWQKAFAVAAVVYGMFPVIVIVLELGRAFKWWS